LLISGLLLGNAYKDYKQERIIWNIYNELPKYVYTANVHLKYEFMDVGGVTKGVIIKRHFIFPAHCAEYKESDYTLFGMVRLNIGKFIKREIRLKGYLLEKVYFNVNEDVAIYKLPEELNIPDFPCAVREKTYLGEKVFIIGNPRLAGLNIRQGNISSLISLKTKKSIHISNTFSIDTTIYPGDSGSPVISSDYKLVGIAVVSFGPDVACMKYIKKFTDHIK